MRVKINFGLVVAVMVGVLILGGIVAVMANPSSQIGSRFGALKNKLPNALDASIDQTDNSTTQDDTATSSTPITPAQPARLPSMSKNQFLSSNQIPWEQGPSNPPPANSTPPINQTPWGQGPSQ